jgi:carbamoylphosphate synthase small subunit
MASLVLEDGTVFKGKLFGSAKNSPGEVGRFSIHYY